MNFLLLGETITALDTVLIFGGIALVYASAFYILNKEIKKEKIKEKQQKLYEKSNEAQRAKELDEYKTKLENERDEFLSQSKINNTSKKSKKQNNEREL